MAKVHLPRVGDRVRLRLLHAGISRAVLWLRVGRDGSIYVGGLIGAPSTGIIGSAPVENGRATVRISEGERLEGPTLPASTRVSFKASGEIHIGNKVANGFPLAELNRLIRLCRVFFAHPSNYREATKRNANDHDFKIDDYPVDDARPIWAEIFVSPWQADAPIQMYLVHQMKHKREILLGFRGLQSTPDLAIQISVGHGPKGSWRELPVVVGGSYTKPS